MRKLYILSLLFIACLHVNAQTSFSLSFNDYEFPVMLQTANKDVVYLSSNFNYAGLWLVRISPQNKLKFSRLISENTVAGAIVFSTSFIETSDKGFAIVGKQGISGSSKQNTIVIKCDSTGNILWQKRLNDGVIDFEPVFPVVCEAPDNSLYVAAGNRYIYHELIKFSSNGSVLWHKRYDTRSEGIAYDYSGITADADNVYFCASVAPCQECSYNYPDIFKLNKNGKLIWEKGLDAYYTVTYLKSLGNDRFNMILREYRSLNNQKFVTGTFNLDSSTVKAKAVAYNIFSLTNYGKKNNLGYMKGSYTGGGYAGGNLINNEWNVYQVSYYVLNKYDALNRLCPDYAIPVIDTTVTNKTISVTALNTVVLTDTAFHISTPAYTSVKTTIPFDVVCAGNAPTINASVASSLNTHTPAISISPNPVKDVMTINTSSISYKNISVINASGKTVLQHAFAGKQHTINVSSLTAGMYYVRVTENNGSSYAIKMVKQ